MKTETEQPKSAQPALRKFRVTIEQPMFHTVTVVAENGDAAEELACERYMDGAEPPGGWNIEYGQFSVSDCNMLPPEAPLAETTDAGA